MRQFRLAVADAELEDLRLRLGCTRWPAELEGAGWDYGVPLSYLQELVEYWRTGYDWREHEARLNRVPQFITEIDGARIHFLHQRSPEPDALPLVVTHGWPGSVVEFLNIIGPLSDPRAHGGDPSDAFHVVAPSLPGYGFSGPTRERGWNPRRIARAWSELMTQLGYERYGAQGGDWGSAVARELAGLDADRVVGIHLNLFMAPAPADFGGPQSLSASDRQALASVQQFRTQRSGYHQVNATRPHTLGYALTDSPVGQLAWIVDKFMEWTGSRERPEEAIARDLMLTNVMLYWLTRTAGSSARLYYEFARADPTTTGVSVPTAVAVFPNDIARPVRAWAERVANIVRWTEFERGGHFPALEVPDLLAGDVRAFFRRLRPTR